MLLKRELLKQIKDGEVDLVFRRWNRPSVRANGTLKTKLGVMQIGTIETISPDSVTEDDARRAGFANVAALQKWLATMKEGNLFQRIEVGFLPDSGDSA